LFCSTVTHPNNGGLLYTVDIEFSYLLLQTACKVETHSCRHATKAANKEKNQNQKCIPCKYFYLLLFIFVLFVVVGYPAAAVL
jgi:Ca2+/Na+ antiporter